MVEFPICVHPETPRETATVSGCLILPKSKRILNEELGVPFSGAGITVRWNGA